MGKFSDYLKEQSGIGDISDDALNMKPNDIFSDKNTEMITLLQRIRDNNSDVQELLAYDKEDLVEFISMSLDYGLYNPVLKK